MRLQAPEMARRLRDGIVAEGATAIDAGMVGTEMLYFLVGSRELDGGAMVTASHNPKAYTGVKLVREGALALSGDAGIGEIRDLIIGGMPDAAGGGSTEVVDVYDDFHRHVLSFIDPAKIRPLKVVVDGGNGMAGPMVGPLLERLGLDLIETYWVPDGEFPDHEPNPLLPENREFVIDRVLDEGADLGIAWDGDADRCFFIDDGGEFVDGDFLTALLARQVLAKDPGGDILYDVRASRAVAGHRHRSRGGPPDQPRRTRLLQDRDARARWPLRRRGLGPLLLSRLLVCRQRRDPGAAGARAALADGRVAVGACRRPARPLLHLRRDQLRGLRSRREDERARRTASRREISRLDGVSVDYPDWHFNVRPSNTEPLLRLNLESLVSKADMEAKRDEVLGFIRS